MKIVTIVGARPQFIKAGSLSRVIQAPIKEIIVHTGQHYDSNMSYIFFDQLQLPLPDYNLGVGSAPHGKQTARMLENIEQILLKEKPEMVLVYGDTNSTLAGALAAAKLHIPVAHVESGLRSYNRRMPEEINRVLTDHISTLLFCPTKASISNLELENITANVHLVGDVMCDSTLFYQPIALQKSTILASLLLNPKTYYVATIHRAENTSHPDQLRDLLETLVKLDYPIVLPLHPRTKKLIYDWKLEGILNCPNIHTIDPLSYLDMLALLSQTELVLTDSGGLQKEAYMLQIPCITLRNETEWIETVQEGWNHIVGIDTQRIFDTIANLVIPNQSTAIFGDGHAAERIFQNIVTYLTANNSS